MHYAPIARIIVRYTVGAVLGADAASIVEGDPDLMSFAALGIGAAVEAMYALAVRRGWAK
jgi:hypothetical protein